MIWLKKANVKHWVCAQLARKIECTGNALLRSTVNGPMKRGRNFDLKTEDTTFARRFFAFNNTWSPTS